MSNIITHTQCIQNLTGFINKVKIKKINFLYFNASDLTIPKMRDTFKVLPDKFNNEDYYIINGFHKNYWYIYKESVIKYLVNILTSGPVYNVNILNVGNQYDVNHGNHIDFGLINLRSNEIVVKTHKTVYTDLGGFIFDRSTSECNFLLKNVKMNKFENTECVKIDNTICGIIKNTYDIIELQVIQYLLEVTIGKRTFTKQGGRRKQKGCGIFDDDFNNLLQNFIIIPISKNRENLSEIKILDDESNKNGNIIIFIDFIEYVRVTILLNKKKLNEDKENYIINLKTEIDKLCNELNDLKS